ncbi:hypothetical protein CNR34_00063 [Pseudomonas phage nickie]|uniref:Uncharacterized protein n=1 Tax=Pseudomonas phage nickie TaxID=2048977 RepID=A0A2H4P746_9CAUD|nr:hypothetical protein FDJ16_gp102 [Pseudomonas phage nickie]ATW57996.1 hypothetical protein CNR34_00063 [Pseudomonas phage nickie]
MQFDKPGCFGNAITYSVKSKSCQECEESHSCALAARQRIEELRSLISVEAILKMSHKSPEKPVEKTRFDADLPETAQKLIAMLPDNAQRTAAQLLRLKVNFRKHLIEGINPIKNQKPLAVAVLFDLLLKGPVERITYLLELKNVLGHSPAVAASQAAIGVAVVVGLGIAKREGENLIIRR